MATNIGAVVACRAMGPPYFILPGHTPSLEKDETMCLYKAIQPMSNGTFKGIHKSTWDDDERWIELSFRRV